MQKSNQIELSPIEATAYWWINIIRNKVRELVIRETSDKHEIKFIEKFYNYTEIDWRNLYLGLIKFITEDVNNYISTGNIMDIDAFNQDTDKKGHDRINEELSKIMCCSIPDIRLASLQSKDSVIYTDNDTASVWYKSCGVTDLPKKYAPTYVLTGNEQELNFYNLVISTIAVLNQRDRNFHSIPILRNGFCEEYKKVNQLQDNLNELTDKFNQAFERASDRKIILGSYRKETYFNQFRDIDYIGLEQYMEIAGHYADVILQKRKTAYSKKLKRN